MESDMRTQIGLQSEENDDTQLTLLQFNVIQDKGSDWINQEVWS